MPRSLLALDLDGTLLRPDGTVDPRDAAAVRRAIDAGVSVTIATGRVATGTLPTARALGLQHPLVCADGSLIVDAVTGARLEQTAIAVSTANDVMNAFDTHSLVPFVLLHDALHCDDRGRPHAEYMRVWTTDVHFHADLSSEQAWRRDGEIAFTVGIGTEDSVGAVHARLRADHAERLDVVSFKIRRGVIDRWALLTRPFGCSKGNALARLSTQLGIAHEHTAVVGDWHNDVPMFQWAKRSFVMGQAPESVRAAATDTLQATSTTGGGVAEAIERWLGV